MSEEPAKYGQALAQPSHSTRFLPSFASPPNVVFVKADEDEEDEDFSDWFADPPKDLNGELDYAQVPQSFFKIIDKACRDQNSCLLDDLQTQYGPEIAALVDLRIQANFGTKPPKMNTPPFPIPTVEKTFFLDLHEFEHDSPEGAAYSNMFLTIKETPLCHLIADKNFHNWFEDLLTKNDAVRDSLLRDTRDGFTALIKWLEYYFACSIPK